MIYLGKASDMDVLYYGEFDIEILRRKYRRDSRRNGLYLAAKMLENERREGPADYSASSSHFSYNSSSSVLFASFSSASS